MYPIRLLLVLALVLVVAGCSSNPPPDDVVRATPAEENEAPLPSDQARGVGTITYFDLEGGFYGLVADDGARYNVMDLDETFEEDGLRVRFHVRLPSGVMTIRQWGKPAEVITMSRLDEQ